MDTTRTALQAQYEKCPGTGQKVQGNQDVRGYVTCHVCGDNNTTTYRSKGTMRSHQRPVTK